MRINSQKIIIGFFFPGNLIFKTQCKKLVGKLFMMMIKIVDVVRGVFFCIMIFKIVEHTLDGKDLEILHNNVT